VLAGLGPQERTALQNTLDTIQSNLATLAPQPERPKPGRP
jgi:hypothetical protein